MGNASKAPKPASTINAAKTASANRASGGSYKTVAGLVEAEIVERKSRFISHLTHVDSEEEARAFIDRIREEHQQARHNVYAYLLRNGRTRYSDDGEPAQTSGLPTFEALEHAGLADIAVVTTRYFGGVLLGTGGLVRAYTSSCNAAIRTARIIEVCSCIDLSLDVSYDMHSSVQRIIANSSATTLSCDYSQHVSLRLRCREEDAETLRLALIEATRGQVPIELSAPHEATL